MDTRTEYQQVLIKHRDQVPVTLRDLAITLANNNADMIQYLLDNDYQQVYRLLHEAPGIAMSVGRNASLIADKTRARAEMLALLGKKDWEDLNYVLGQFQINLQANNWTSHADLLEKMRDIELIKPYKNTYCFNAKFA